MFKLESGFINDLRRLFLSVEASLLITFFAKPGPVKNIRILTGKNELQVSVNTDPGIPAMTVMLNFYFLHAR